MAVAKYTGKIIQIIDQSKYKINCIFESPGSPNPITFSGFPVLSDKPLTVHSSVYIEGNWAQHKSLGSIIKGMIRPTGDKHLPKIKKQSQFNAAKFVNDLQQGGIKVKARDIED